MSGTEMGIVPEAGREDEAGGRVPATRAARRPKIGFLGVGWIGRHRLERVVESGVAEVVGIADSSEEALRAGAAVAPDAVLTDSIDVLLDAALDGLVIATPSALHAEQAIAALERGVAVFCQKPLGRTHEEAAAVVAAAERADRLLGVDLSYRYAEAFRAAREVVASGEIGHVYAVDLVFHNAYGPDKAWFYDPALSGGGCVMDLGVHLVDYVLWSLGFPEVVEVSGHLFSGGTPLRVSEATGVEDYATARLELAGGECVQLACSWKLPAGQDAVISATFFGTAGGVCVRNVGGSFYDFLAERYRGTSRETLVDPPDAWGGRAAVAWAEQLRTNGRFDPAARELQAVAAIIDRIYGR